MFLYDIQPFQPSFQVKSTHIWIITVYHDVVHGEKLKRGSSPWGEARARVVEMLHKPMLLEFHQKLSNSGRCKEQLKL